MLKIDNNLLVEVGLGGLPDSEKNSFLKHIYDTLEMRVGIRLADQMTNEQLDEFERYFEAKDDAGAFKWLETNFPNYKEIVQEEFDKLKAEVKQTAPQILAASGAGAPSTQEAPSTPVAQPGVVPPAPSPQPSVPPVEPPLPASQPGFDQPTFSSPQPEPQAQPQPLPQDPQAQPQFQQPQSTVPPTPPLPPTPAPVTEQPSFQPANPQPAQPSPIPPQPPMPEHPPQPPVPEQPPVPPASMSNPAPAPTPQFPEQQPPAGPGQPPAQSY